MKVCDVIFAFLDSSLMKYSHIQTQARTVTYFAVLVDNFMVLLTLDLATICLFNHI